MGITVHKSKDPRGDFMNTYCGRVYNWAEFRRYTIRWKDVSCKQCIKHESKTRLFQREDREKKSDYV